MLENERYVVITDIPTTPYGYQYFGCRDCGALVYDRSAHDYFHDELNEATGDRFEFKDHESD